MRIYLIRHADPDYPNNTITPAGHEEARALAQRLAREKIDRIYCSPLGRALHTMQYTADLIGLEPAVEEWTAELSDCGIEVPPWGTLAMWNVPGEVIRERSPLPGHADWHELPCLANPVLRQRFDEVNHNSDAFLARHGYKRQGTRYRITRSTRERIAIFCHAGFGLCWLAHLLEIPLPLMWSGFWMSPSSVTTVLMDERSEQWAVPRLLGFGDTSHLYAAGLPVQPRGILANFD
jgi:broad specificity phosphatase PhoE